jgi:hypothetical protein
MAEEQDIRESTLAEHQELQRLRQQIRDYEKKIANEKARFEEEMAKQKAEFEKKIKQRESRFDLLRKFGAELEELGGMIEKHGKGLERVNKIQEELGFLAMEQQTPNNAEGRLERTSGG